MSAVGLVGSGIAPLDSSWVGLGVVLVAATMLDAFDISLPRGDSAGGAGALCAAAILVVGPVKAVAVALVAAVIAHLARRGAQRPMRLAMVLGARVPSLLIASAAAAGFEPRGFFTAASVVVPAAFLASELAITQALSALRTKRSFVGLIRGNVGSQAALLVAQWSASVLLLLTYDGMRGWSLVPVTVLLLLMRQSYALFLSIRETYRTTVEVLVQAAESQDARRAGHSDRTAAIARSIASACGLSSAQVESVGYAALLHDLGSLAELPVPGATDRHASSADVVREVEFFKNVEPILRVCEGTLNDTADDEVLFAGLVVALASDIDAEYHAEVAAAHEQSTLGRFSSALAPASKARAVAAALRLGYRTPAVP